MPHEAASAADARCWRQIPRPSAVQVELDTRASYAQVNADRLVVPSEGLVETAHQDPVDPLPLGFPRQARDAARRGGLSRRCWRQIPRPSAGTVQVELGTYFVQEEAVGGHQRARAFAVEVVLLRCT